MAVIDNLKAYWSLEEASGTREDAHGTNDLTDNNTVTQTTGKVANCAQFTAANNEYLSIANNANIVLGNFDFTYAGWVYFNATGAEYDFLSKWNYTTPSNEVLFRRTSGDIIRAFISSDGTDPGNVSIDGASVTNNTWYFVAFRHDSVNNLLRLRVNATDATPVSHSAGVFAGTSDLYLGALFGPGSPLDGRMDEWGYWNAHKTDAELTWLYNSGNGRSYTDIVNEAGGGGAAPYASIPRDPRAGRKPSNRRRRAA